MYVYACIYIYICYVRLTKGSLKVENITGKKVLNIQ